MAFFRADNISISFGGVKALRGVSFDVEKGQVFSIIGPNGAGKTTIFNCINRFYDLDEGRLFFRNGELTAIKPHMVADRGIARTFQNIELFKNMTVVDNIILGRHRRRKTSALSEILFLPSVRKQEFDIRQKTEEIIDFLNLQACRHEIISSLPYGIQKTVELGRALAMEPELLLLDEPSSGLNQEEAEDLRHWIEDIKEEMQITIVVVEHNIGLVQRISDHVLALNFGSVLTQGEPSAVLAHPDVIKAYLGEENAFAQAQ